MCLRLFALQYKLKFIINMPVLSKLKELHHNILVIFCIVQNYFQSERNCKILVSIGKTEKHQNGKNKLIRTGDG